MNTPSNQHDRAMNELFGITPIDIAFQEFTLRAPQILKLAREIVSDAAEAYAESKALARKARRIEQSLVDLIEATQEAARGEG